MGEVRGGDERSSKGAPELVDGELAGLIPQETYSEAFSGEKRVEAARRKTKK